MYSILEISVQLQSDSGLVADFFQSKDFADFRIDRWNFQDLWIDPGTSRRVPVPDWGNVYSRILNFARRVAVGVASVKTGLPVQCGRNVSVYDLFRLACVMNSASPNFDTVN